MADIGLLVDISDPGGGDRGGALGPLNLRRGRNSLASSHPKTLEEEDDPFGLLERAKETRTGAPARESFDVQTQVGTLISVDRSPVSGPIATPLHLVTPSPCLQDSVFSPSLDSQTSDEPNWDQLQSDAQSLASSCSEQPSLSSFPSISSSLGPSFTPASHRKMEMDSPLALFNLSKEDSGAFLVALTPDKPPAVSLADQMSTMLLKAEDEPEAKLPDQEKVAAAKVGVGEAFCEKNPAHIEAQEAPTTPKNKEADIKALKRRLSAIKENRNPDKSSAKTCASQANSRGRRSLAPVQPRLSLGSIKTPHRSDTDVKKDSKVVTKSFQSKPALLQPSKLNKAPSTPSSLKPRTPLTFNKSKQTASTMAPPAEGTKRSSVRATPVRPSTAAAASTGPVSVGVHPNLSPSISESGRSEVTSSPVGPPQASSSTPLRKGHVLGDVSKAVKADPKMPQLKGSAISRSNQLGLPKSRLLSAKTPTSAMPNKPIRPEARSMRSRDSLNSSIQNMRNSPSFKKPVASSLNTTGPSPFSSETSLKKVETPLLRPAPNSRLKPPNSGLRPPSSGLKLPSAGLKPPHSSEDPGMLSTPKMRPPSAIRPPSLSRQGLSSTPQSRMRSSLPSPQVAHPMHSTPRRNLQTPVRGQQ